MRKRRVRAPLAVTSDGVVLLNTAELGIATDDDSEADVFVPLSPAELRRLYTRLDNAMAEALAHIVGQRRFRKARRRSRARR